MNTNQLKKLKAKGIQVLNFAAHNVAPSGGAPLWKRADSILHLVPNCVVTKSAAGNLYLKPEEGVVFSGRAFKEIQDFDEGETMDVLVKQMIPNDEITDDLLETYEKTWPGSTKAYRDAVANEYVQFHFAEEYIEE